MAFSKEVYYKAFEEKKRLQHNAVVLYERKKEEIYTATPELAKIDMALGKNGAAAAAAAIAGDTERVNSLKDENLKLAKQKDDILKNFISEDEQFDCLLCHDTGYRDGLPCECVEKIAEKIAAEELKKETGADIYGFDNFSLEYYKDGTAAQSPRKRMTQILKICREFAESMNGKSLLLLGGTGLGKTHLSLAIAHKAVENGNYVIYGSVQNLMNNAAAEQFSYSGSTEYIDSLLYCDLLIIDDLGAEMQTQFTAACIYNIINTRILRGLSTVINTNLTLGEIGERYTPRVLSRMLEKYTALNFLGEDIRQQKAMKALKKKQ